MKIILTENQFKRIILKEDERNCPKGFMYDVEVDNCVEVQELDSVTVLTFRDPNTQKTYDNYRDLYYDISKEFNKSGKELDEKFNVDNYDKLDNDFLIKLTNDLKNLYEKEKDSLSVNWVKNNIDTHIGKPYIWGDEGPESFDCSGFIDYTLSLGRTTANGYYEKYKDLLKSDVADISNCYEGRYAGASTAAIFLQEFVEKTPWVHLDIAPTMSNGKSSGADVKGMSGSGVRTLIEYLDNK